MAGGRNIMTTATLARQRTPDLAFDTSGILERACQRYLGMSSEEFLQKWQSGYFQAHPELALKAADVALLLPLVE